MNERIIEIVKQSGGRWNHGDHNMGSSIEFQEEDIEKFAELIVMECENVAKNPQWYRKNSSNDWCNSIKHVCNVMKEHFGVNK